ncbi:hypothetical protein BDZ89DRAFT_1066131 [Hymenopellis radicata]|nr:hypothetical protein BDZ89DRAFT_1066131 [Hymenopellis radicata]
MDHHISNEDRLKIAHFISNSDYSGHRIDLLEKRLSGTGTWVIQHPDFVAWRDDQESPRTLWCYGNPGAGKSVAAAFIADHLQSTGNIVLSVFCRYSLDAFTTPLPVLRGLLRQLIEKTTKVPPSICDRYWSGTHPSPEELPNLLAEVAAYHTRPLYIVIDALDECPIGIDLLRAIQQLSSSFRVLVTSRPVFREINEHPSIQIRASDDDILIAADTTLSRLKHAWLDEELKEKMRVQVVKKADGMFLLASLQLRELERDVTCQRDVLVILDSLPRTLDDAYKLTFQRIRAQGERKNELACRTLALTTENRFDSDDIQYILSAGDRTQWIDIETILQCCHGLLQMPLKFIHYSVYEYTISHWSELFPENPNRFNVCLQVGSQLACRPCCWPAPTPLRASFPEQLSDIEQNICNQFIYMLSCDAIQSIERSATSMTAIQSWSTERPHIGFDGMLSV